MIRGVPGWAYDTYSREGGAALRVFLEGQSQTAKWVRAHVPYRQRLKFLGGILFRVEGGLVGKRMRWPVGDELRRQMDLECHGQYCPDAREILELMRADIPVLNGVRDRLRFEHLQDWVGPINRHVSLHEAVAAPTAPAEPHSRDEANR